MITTLGFVMMIAIIALILTRRLSPIVAFALLPVLVSLLAGFSPGEIGGFVKQGVLAVAPTATLFIFAILYFGIMRERGLFDPLVAFLLRRTRGRPVRVTLSTVLIAAIAHLDGIGAATFLLTIPALLPIYKRLEISPLVLVCLVGLSAGVVNMVPWGGPTARAAAVSGIDATALWTPLLPVQLFGLVLMLALAGWFGLRAQRRLRGQGLGADDPALLTLPERSSGLSTQDWRYWANLGLTLLVLVALFTGLFPLYLTFMIGLALALLLNYPDPARQGEQISEHAASALQMALVMLAAGILLGVLAGTEMSEGMADTLIALLPGQTAGYLHLIVGVFGVPLQMIFSPDAYYFALMPIVRDVSQAAGVPLEAVARAMLIGENTGFSVSPVVPSVYLAIGLANVELRSHIRFTFLWAWGLSIVLLGFAVLIGAVPV
ncbi:CitMHS family transporter [Kushneria phosphatilytica]|uniref:Citrate transporter n=1 Tax=Kushneria phosphatilytica TaxID=657387 RepID=A0A1S1NSJ4_9GAMM|nr:citrate:proton symporter [Kushneria phosphatilytica]OHV08448.1 citrate transporter [Kushneria phosphatilytica]QEL09876.1 citrate transporter [Kushneria phosphatilytica]